MNSIANPHVVLRRYQGTHFYTHDRGVSRIVPVPEKVSESCGIRCRPRTLAEKRYPRFMRAVD